MKINVKAPIIAISTIFATLALSSSSLCFGSRLMPYHMQIVGKYFEKAEDYKDLSMVSKKYGDLTGMYHKNFVNVSKSLKDRYLPNIQTYVAYAGANSRKLMDFRGNIKSLVYLENSFGSEEFIEILCNTGVIRSKCGEKIIFDRENWLCREMKAESGKGFILSLVGIGKENSEKTIEFHFDLIKISVMPDRRYDIFIGSRKYNSMLNDISHVLDVLGVNSKDLNVGGITAINIPQSVTKISSSSFYGCYALREINIPNTVKSIGESAFQSCIDLKKVKLPDTLKKISDKSFQGCTELREIEIPASVEEIGESAFDFCVMLNKVNIPNSVKKLGKGCFLNCTSLIEVYIPGSVKKINRAAFACCNLLKKVVISEGTEYIGLDSFANCPILEEVSIPTSVKEIDAYAFSDCPRLTVIKYGGKTYNNINSFMAAFKANKNGENIQNC